MIDEIHTGSYKGAEFRIKSSSVAGGRKDIKHEFPNSNTQNIEDLGFKPKAYTINAFISEPNYTQKKDRLLADPGRRRNGPACSSVFWKH